MRYKRMLLVEPNYVEDFYQASTIPVGIGYIDSYLRANGVETDVIDMGLDLGRRYTYASLNERIRTFKPDAVGVSIMSYRYLDHYRMINHIRQTGDWFDIVAGGVHVSTLKHNWVFEDFTTFKLAMSS